MGWFARVSGIAHLVQDYKPTPYLIEHVYLDFLLNEDTSTVKSKLSMTPNYGDSSSAPKLALDGMTLPRLVQIYTPPMIAICCLYRKAGLPLYLHERSAFEP